MDEDLERGYIEELDDLIDRWISSNEYREVSFVNWLETDDKSKEILHFYDPDKTDPYARTHE